MAMKVARSHPQASTPHSSRSFFSKASTSKAEVPFFSTQLSGTVQRRVEPVQRPEEEEKPPLQMKSAEETLQRETLLEKEAEDIVQPQALAATPIQRMCAECEREQQEMVTLQPKLTVGQPNDQYEQEADRVADQVMRMPDPMGAAMSQVGQSSIQRLCLECGEDRQRQPQSVEEEDEEKRKRLQMKSMSGLSPEASSDLQARITNLQQGGGQPLSVSERAFLEPRFGQDFSRVRIHTDARAAETARSVNARAFTVGRDVVFGSGQYQPRSSEGQRLLAHELTHVVQQIAPSLQDAWASTNSGSKSSTQPLIHVNDSTSSAIIQLSPLSDELEQVWYQQGRDVFFERLRHVQVSDPDVLTFITNNLNGDDLWLATNIFDYGPEANWPIHLRVEREMKGWGNSGGKGAVFELLRVANGTQAGNTQLTASLNRVFGAGTGDIWLAQNLQVYGREANWPIHLRVEHEMRGVRIDSSRILTLLASASDLSVTIRDLDAANMLQALISRINEPANRRELIQLLGSRLNSSVRALVEPHIRAIGQEWELQFNLGRLGVTSAAPTFNPSPLESALVSSDPRAPFTGSGATGVSPTSLSISLTDQSLLAAGHSATVARYSNPIPGSLPAYLATLSPTERAQQAELLLRRQISSIMAQSYAGKIPSRAQVIRGAAREHNLQPQLVAAFLLAEQRDQSRNEDAKDYLGATSRIFQGNTSIGLGQVVVSTARRGDLFADLLSSGTRSGLGHNEIAERLASDEFNIFASARYIRQVANDGTTRSIATLLRTQTRFPGLNLAAYANNSSTWSDDNIRVLGMYYTSRAWTDDIGSAAWGDFVFEAYQDVIASSVF